MKTCNKCLASLPDGEFFPCNGRRCKKCVIQVHKKWAQENRDKIAAYSKAYVKKNHGYVKSRLKEYYRKNRKSLIEKARLRAEQNKERRVSQNRERNKQLRDRVVQAYGSACVCCGESEKIFLQFDHVENDGNSHRTKVGVGATFYRWLEKNNFPKSIQLLCANCNYGKMINSGICPHQRIVVDQRCVPCRVGRSRFPECCDLIRNKLKDGPASAEEMRELLHSNGFTFSMATRAKKIVGALCRGGIWRIKGI